MIPPLAYVHLHTNVHLNVLTHAHTQKHTHTHLHVHSHLYLHIHVHTYINADTPTSHQFVISGDDFQVDAIIVQDQLRHKIVKGLHNGQQSEELLRAGSR